MQDVLTSNLERSESSKSLAVDTAPPSSPATSFDLSVFCRYLTRLIPLLLGAEEHDLETLYEVPEFSERASKWASDPSAGVVYVVKTRDEREAGKLNSYSCER